MSETNQQPDLAIPNPCADQISSGWRFEWSDEFGAVVRRKDDGHIIVAMVTDARVGRIVAAFLNQPADKDTPMTTVETKYAKAVLLNEEYKTWSQTEMQSIATHYLVPVADLEALQADNQRLKNALSPPGSPCPWKDTGELVAENLRMHEELKSLQAKVKQLEHERGSLASAIGELAVYAGIIKSGTPLTGPQLLQIVEDVKSQFKSTTPPPSKEYCSDWYCSNCGKPSSYQGHYDPKIKGFTCEPNKQAKAEEIAREVKAAVDRAAVETAETMTAIGGQKTAPLPATELAKRLRDEYSRFLANTFADDLPEPSGILIEAADALDAYAEQRQRDAEEIDRLLHSLTTRNAELNTAEDQLRDKDTEIERLAWNLAGCSTIACSGKPTTFDETKALPALREVNELAKRAEQAERELDWFVGWKESHEQQLTTLRRAVEAAGCTVAMLDDGSWRVYNVRAEAAEKERDEVKNQVYCNDPNNKWWKPETDIFKANVTIGNLADANSEKFRALKEVSSQLAEAVGQLNASRCLDDDQRTEAKIWRRHRDAFLSRHANASTAPEQAAENGQ